MSFVSILKKIAKDALIGVGVADQIAQVATPFIAPMLSGPALAAEQAIAKGIHIAEASITTAQSGIAKKQTASAIAMSELPNAEAIVAEFGGNLKLTPEGESALSTAIDAAVAARNALALFIGALKPKANA